MLCRQPGSSRASEINATSPYGHDQNGAAWRCTQPSAPEAPHCCPDETSLRPPSRRAVGETTVDCKLLAIAIISASVVERASQHSGKECSPLATSIHKPEVLFTLCTQPAKGGTIHINAVVCLQILPRKLHGWQA